MKPPASARMPTNADNWSLIESSATDSPDVAIYRKNLAPPVKPGSASHSFVCYLTFHYEPRDASGLPAPSDADSLVEIEQREIPALEEEGLSVLVGVVLKGGVKDFIFYTRDPEEFLSRAASIRDAHPEYDLECEVGPNKSWSHYEDLP